MVGPDGQAQVRCAARHRTFPADGLRAHGNSNYDRRPKGLYQAVASEGTGAPGDGLRRHRSALREQCRHSAPGREIQQIRVSYWGINILEKALIIPRVVKLLIFQKELRLI